MTSRNRAIAEKLREAAEILEQQEANPFRVHAYRRAADTVAGLREDLRSMIEREGMAGVVALPGVGPRIAAAIDQLVRTGRWSQLERLRGTIEPDRLFQLVPGVGPTLARRIHEVLDADTLEALEIAAHDGRLAAVPGIGPRRSAMIRTELATMLGRARGRPFEHVAEPSVTLLLEVDAEYRARAASGSLPSIAPRRFNPSGEAWLPVLHTERGGWHFTAMFSNTALAHRVGRTRDWVVLYFHTDHGPEGQRTVVTETRGALSGQRVVRGREVECEGQLGRERPAGPRPPDTQRAEIRRFRGGISDAADVASREEATR